MKKISLLLAIVFCFSLVGCGKNTAPAALESTNSVETNQSTESVESTEIPEDTASEDFAETPDSVDNEEAEEDDGTYWLSGYLKSSEKDKSGEPDEYGVIQPIIYVAKIDGDSLIIEGTTNFRNEESQDPVGMGPGDYAEFIITDETVFQMVGGEYGPETVTKEEFAGYLESCADSGILLDLKITGAKVTIAKIRS